MYWYLIAIIIDLMNLKKFHSSLGIVFSLVRKGFLHISLNIRGNRRCPWLMVIVYRKETQCKNWILQLLHRIYIYMQSSAANWFPCLIKYYIHVSQEIGKRSCPLNLWWGTSGIFLIFQNHLQQYLSLEYTASLWLT